MRHKDAYWSLPERPTYDQAPLSVLMDIRDELKELNRLFRCPNFLNIPRKLDLIQRNTKKRKRRVTKR